MLAYSFVLMVGLVVSSPWWLLRMATTERYREGLGERLGRVPERLGWLFRGSLPAKRVAWVHAVSVGEVLAASRLVVELEAGLLLETNEEWMVVVSTTTRTGQALARERFGASRVFYCPLDFAFAVRAYLRVLRPSVLVLMESELWPRMLHECKRSGVPVVVVNARVSDRSFSRAMKLRSVWKNMLRVPSLWLAQSDEDARRLVAMGASAENVQANGNLKYDVMAKSETPVSAMVRRCTQGWRVVVVGSTVSDGKVAEEKVFLDAVAHFYREFPIRYVIAPRHPERFDEVFALISRNQKAVRASELMKAEKPGSEWTTMLLDTIGDLAAVYSVADVAFVGGSLVKRGGHNPLEPAQFGVPVVMGPSYENFRDVVETMRAAGGISVLGKTAGLSTALRSGRDDSSEVVQELERELIRVLTDHEAARTMGERGRAVFEVQQGATGRAVEAIVGMVTQ